jgi:nitrite reductase/ring-hydroxylating ferredoxin subunit
MERNLNFEENNEEYPVRIIDSKTYVNVCRSDEVFERKGMKISFREDTDMQVAIFRIDGKLYCVSNICPHEHTEKMHQGYIEGMNLICPYHAWTYSIETGKNVDLKRGIKSLEKYDIFEEDGFVFIEKPVLEIPLWRK